MAIRSLQHHLNALHVMALFVRVGISKSTALALARWWEQPIRPVLYPATRPLIPVRVSAPARGPLRVRRRYE